ncbi:MAG: GNAT family N-acetyltransferase [Candidatus Bathyarchaeia archaeon]
MRFGEVFEMRGLPDLEGEKVILTAFKEEYAEDYFRWLRDPEILKMAGEESLSLEGVLDRHRRWTDDDKFIEYIIIDKGSGRPIGDVSVDLRGGDAKFGITIAERSFRNRGCATEAFNLIAEYVKGLGVTHLIAEIYDFNTASMKFHEKIGFVRVGHDGERGEWIYRRELR